MEIPDHMSEMKLERHNWLARRFVGHRALRVLALTGLSFGLAKAGLIGIDQSNTGFTPGLYQNPSFFSPMGQSFTPSQSSLNFIELFESLSLSLSPAILEVSVHSGSIFGPTLGMSLPSAVSADGPVPFYFASPVPLIPGSLFFIEVTVSAGQDLIGSSGGPFSTYLLGDEILLGQPQTGNDLWFAEGTVPEPSAFILVAAALAAMILLGSRRAFRPWPKRK
jgi:hypothetical protein